MREPLVDITNTPLTPCANLPPSSSSKPITTRSQRPKVLRQTSLFAFAAAAAVAAPASPRHPSTSSPPTPPTIHSTTPSPALTFGTSSPASRLASSPPSSSWSPSPPPPASSSSTTPTFPDNKDDDGDDDDDVFASTTQSHEVNKRQRLSNVNTSGTYQHPPPTTSHDSDDSDDEVELNPVVQARRMQRMLINRGEPYPNRRLLHSTPTTPAMCDALRHREYSCVPSTSKTPYNELLRDHTIPDPYPASFVSHNTLDVYRCVSVHPHRDYAPPFAAVFSNASKRGTGKKLVAVSDEEGTVAILDAEKREEHDGPAPATHLRPHNNAVFDVRWSADDRTIATGSGDQSVVITDVETKTPLSRLVGHTGTIKQIAYDPHNPNLLSTASRDGAIGVWDLRAPTKDNTLGMVNHIRFAHDVYARSRKGKETNRSSTRSVTSIVYMQHQENLLASAGSADGVIKLWDLRKAAARRINPPSVEESLDFAATPTRSYGTASLCLSPDGAKVYALSTNSKIYVHDARYLSRPSEVAMHILSAPTYSSLSFYMRLSISPCGHYLASGSSGHGFGTHIWDVSKMGSNQNRTLWSQTNSPSAVLWGNTAEVNSLDWADDGLITCSDDTSVRLWRPEIHLAKAARENPESAQRWKYSGTWNPAHA